MSLRQLSIFFCFLLILQACTTSQTASNQNTNAPSNAKTLLFEDNVYEDRIKTVLFYPSGGSATSVLNPPIVNRSQPSNLLLEFDDLGKEYCNYYAKVYHCNANWTRSNYTDLQLVSDYNEYMIQDYQASINTKIRYNHYRFGLPRVKLT